MKKLSFVKKKFLTLTIYNLFFITPQIFFKATSDSYLFIKYIFISINILMLIYLNSIFRYYSFNKILSRLPLSVPFLTFILAAVVSIARIEVFYNYFLTIMNWVLLFFLYYFIASESNLKNIIKILTCLTFSGFIVSIYGLLQYLNLGKLGPFDFDPGRDSYNLLMHPSTLGHDNYAGEFLAALIPFVISLAAILFCGYDTPLLLPHHHRVLASEATL